MVISFLNCQSGSYHVCAWVPENETRKVRAVKKKQGINLKTFISKSPPLKNCCGVSHSFTVCNFRKKHKGIWYYC
jgi:hypothetical protein